MNKILVAVSVWLVFGGAWAKNRGANKCSKSKLEQRSCDLQFAGVNIRLTSEKILVNDGTWRSISLMPLSGDKTNWQSVKGRVFGQRKFLEMMIWSKPSGEAELQSLHWIVVELLNREIKVHLDRVVQRRRRVQDGEGKKYLNDRRERVSLKRQSKKKIKWRAGNKSGVI